MRDLRDDDPRLSRILVFRANLLAAQKRYAEAEPVAARALSLIGPGDIRNIMALNTLSIVHAYLRRYDESIAELRRALDLLERAYGPSHPMRARLYGTLSDTYADAGRPGEADLCSRQAVDIAVAAFGPGSRLAAEMLFVRAALLKKVDRPAEAEAARRDARAALGSVLRGSGQTVDVSELAR